MPHASRSHGPNGAAGSDTTARDVPIVHAGAVKHSELEIGKAYAAEGGTLYSLIDNGKYVLSREPGAEITPSPTGAKSFGVLVVAVYAGDAPSDADVDALLAETAKYREHRPTTVARNDDGYRVDVVSLSTLQNEWTDFLRQRQRVADAAEERARLKDAVAAVFGEAASEPLLAGRLREAGMLNGRLDLDIFVPDAKRLLTERRYWEDSTSLEPTRSIELSTFLKAEADTALRRGYGPDAYFTHLSTSRDLSAATRHGDGYLVPVEVTFEVISPTEYVARLDRAFGGYSPPPARP